MNKDSGGNHTAIIKEGRATQRTIRANTTVTAIRGLAAG